MASRARRYVRQMPQIYGNLQPQSRPVWQWIVRGLRILVIAGILVGAVVVLFFSPFFQVREVTVTGASFTSADTAKAAVPMGGNIWLLSSSAIQNRVQSDPAVSSVQVLRGIPHGIHLIVTEKEPMLIWQSGSQIALVDEDGEVFKVLPMTALQDPSLAKAAASLPQVVDTTNLPFQSGQLLLSPVFVRFLSGFTSDFHTVLPNLAIDKFTVGASTYEVTLLTKQGLQVRLNTLNDPGVQARNLARLVTQAKLPMTAKVDLRVDRWAYVQ